MQAVVTALGGRDRFLVTSHEAPDGDALGSLLATGLALGALGKDAVMFLGGPAPLPGEYRFLELADQGLRRELPADSGERVLVAVDCASAGRVGAEPGLVERAPFTINIDHHHDNPRFGDVNLIVPDASSTGEVLADVFRELEIELTPELAEALYIALVTDTGRFQYQAVTPETIRLGAQLREFPFDHTRLVQALYEDNSLAYLRLLGVALERVALEQDADLLWTYLTQADLAAAGVPSSETDDLIDVVRTAREADVTAVVKQQRDGRFKVSLRSKGAHDVAAVAGRFGGGGHRLAAGYTSAVGLGDTVERLKDALGEDTIRI